MLPYGYTVSLIIAFFPSIWYRTLNPLAQAVAKDEKLTKEQKKYQELWIGGTMLIFSIVVTYVCFFVIGFHYQNWSFISSIMKL